MHFPARDQAQMGAQPRGEVLFPELAFGQGEVNGEELQVVGFERGAIELQEGFAGDGSLRLLPSTKGWLRASP